MYFSCVSHLYVFFGETSVYVLPLLFDCVDCFSGIELYGCLYILEVNPLSVVSFAIIFQNMQASHTTQCQKNKKPNQKVGKKPKQTFLQRRHTDG